MLSYFYGKEFFRFRRTQTFWSKAKSWIAEQITAEVTAKIAEIVANAPEDLDTLKEIANWISTHEDSASAMNTAILANKTAISGKADKIHTHTKSEITDFPTSLKNPNALTINGKTYDGSSAVNAGVQTVANGGTGVTTQADINKAFIDDLEEGSSDVTDSTEFVSSYASDNGFSDTNAINKPYKRKFSKVWNYIKGKADSIYAASSHTHTKSQITDFPTSLPANGGTANKTVNDITIDIPYVTESGQYVIPLGNILEPTSTEINSPYNWDITGFFSIIRNVGHNGSHIQFEAGHGYSHDWTTYAYLDKLDFRGVIISMKAFRYNEKWWLGLYISTSNQGYGGKMTIIYRRGLPATPTCILYNSKSGGVANKEINDSIQDIPSSWWKTRTICNPTSFSDTLYVNGLIKLRQGTYDGSIVSIGREDGNITIGDTSNNNRGNTVINNDCKMRYDLGVFGESNFVGPCYFNENIFVHNKSLFPSGYIPRTYCINADITDMTMTDKTLLKKFFAFLQKDRCVQVSGWLYYKVTITSSPSEVSAPGIGFVGYQDYEGSPIVIDDNNNITVNSDYSCNYCMVGGTDNEGKLACWDLFLLADTILNNKWSKINNLRLGLTFTLLEKV